MSLHNVTLDAAWPSGWEITVALAERYWMVLLVILLVLVTAVIIRKRNRK